MGSWQISPRGWTWFYGLQDRRLYKKCAHSWEVYAPVRFSHFCSQRRWYQLLYTSFGVPDSPARDILHAPRVILPILSLAKVRMCLHATLMDYCREPCLVEGKQSSQDILEAILTQGEACSWAVQNL